MVDELVTNATRHAGTTDPIRLSLEVEDTDLRVAVEDAGAGFDPTARSPRRRGGGWGLDVVGTLSSRWGVDRRDGGTTVWFEMVVDR